MKKKQLIIFSSLLLITAAVLVGGWRYEQRQDQDGQLQIVTSFYPVYAFTKGVVGDEADVSLLIKAGTEPHDFSPSTKDISDIQNADAFIYENDNMETWISKVKKVTKTDQTPIIQATGDMLLLAGSEEDHDHAEGEADHNHAYDPHVWLSPYRAKMVVASIRDQLIKQFPDKKASFEANAQAYLKQLDSLDKDYQEAFASVKQKTFITQHTAFSYLALDYGLEQVAINGISGDSDPSSKRLAQLSQQVEDYGIKYIYFEENTSDRLSKTLAQEAGVKTLTLNPLESLTQEQLDNGVDYLSVMRDNLKALKKSTDQAGKSLPEEETAKTVANGYFKDSQVQERPLSNWTGEWQSVYPYLQDGTLDQVWDYKAKLNKDKTAAAYKDYYTVGYQTDVTTITINGKTNRISFTKDGKSQTYTYVNKGYKILTYEKGNRGVRYLFEAKEADAGEYKYLQFSDHTITDTESAHFHIYWGGESQDKLFQEMEHWPTYYPGDWSGHQIGQDMVAHG